jgi:hypothetical protein
MLTQTEVEAKWEFVRLRVRTRKDGAKISALLCGYTVVGIEETEQTPVIVCKANSDFHYNVLQSNESYHEIIRWALKVTLETECDIRLLSPHAQTENEVSI